MMPVEEREGRGPLCGRRKFLYISVLVLVLVFVFVLVLPVFVSLFMFMSLSLSLLMFLSVPLPLLVVVVVMLVLVWLLLDLFFHAFIWRLFPTLYKRLKNDKGEDFIWATFAPCPILLVRETTIFTH